MVIGNNTLANSDTSLLVSTYNWPEALELCLGSIARQSRLPGEVIICDDGSGPATAEVISRMQITFPIPLVHIWQPDEGFRLSAIRNKGIAAARGKYIIQIDGDLILHRHFVRDHIDFRRPGYFVTGSRMMLSHQRSQALLRKEVADNRLFHHQNQNWLNAIRFPLMTTLLANNYKSRGRKRYYVKGCNMAFWKTDLFWVNGYNESIIGWGNEDSEIAIRLMNAGIQKRFLKFSGVCFHIHHIQASTDKEENNAQIMQETIHAGITRISNGIHKSTVDGRWLPDNNYQKNATSRKISASAF